MHRLRDATVENYDFILTSTSYSTTEGKSDTLPLQRNLTVKQPCLIVHVSVNVLLGLGSDVGIIIESSIILMLVHRNCYR